MQGHCTLASKVQWQGAMKNICHLIKARASRQERRRHIFSLQSIIANYDANYDKKK